MNGKPLEYRMSFYASAASDVDALARRFIDESLREGVPARSAQP
jgi:hypothetical protein